MVRYKTAATGLLMHLDPYIILGSAIVGFLVGMTGAAGVR
jgi:hypothetical protein